jgi:hypothetical protein
MRVKEKPKKRKNAMRTVGRGLEDLAKLPWILNGEIMEEEKEASSDFGAI